MFVTQFVLAWILVPDELGLVAMTLAVMTRATLGHGGRALLAVAEFGMLVDIAAPRDDLGIDSLDFLDVAFAIDKAFGIKMPLEQWTQEVNEGGVSRQTNSSTLVRSRAAVSRRCGKPSPRSSPAS